VPDGDNDINEYFGKLTANPTPSLLIDGSFRYRGVDATNQDITATVAPSAGDNPKSIDRVLVGSAFWTVNSRLSFEARFNHNENNGSVSPNTFIPFKQGPFNAAAPYLSGSFITTIVTRTGQSFIFPPANSTGQRIGGSDLAQNDQNFFRNEYRLQSSYLANFLGATHDIRAGFTLSENKEDLIRAADGWGTISVVDTATAGTCSPAGNPNGGRPCYRARYTTPGNQISRGKTYGVFLQDQATWNRLTVNAGVLVNEDYYIPNDTSSFNVISGNYKTPGSARHPVQHRAGGIARVHLQEPYQHALEQAVPAALRLRVRDRQQGPRQDLREPRPLRQPGQPVHRARGRPDPPRAGRHVHQHPDGHRHPGRPPGQQQRDEARDPDDGPDLHRRSGPRLRASARRRLVC
jgi:hypothetical protein